MAGDTISWQSPHVFPTTHQQGCETPLAEHGLLPRALTTWDQPHLPRRRWGAAVPPAPPPALGRSSCGRSGRRDGEGEG